MECWVQSSLWARVCGLQEWIEKTPQKISFVVQNISSPMK